MGFERSKLWAAFAAAVAVAVTPVSLQAGEPEREQAAAAALPRAIVNRDTTRSRDANGCDVSVDDTGYADGSRRNVERTLCQDGSSRTLERSFDPQGQIVAESGYEITSGGAVRVLEGAEVEGEWPQPQSDPAPSEVSAPPPDRAQPEESSNAQFEAWRSTIETQKAARHRGPPPQAR